MIGFANLAEFWFIGHPTATTKPIQPPTINNSYPPVNVGRLSDNNVGPLPAGLNFGGGRRVVIENGDLPLRNSVVLKMVL